MQSPDVLPVNSERPLAESSSVHHSLTIQKSSSNVGLNPNPDMSASNTIHNDRVAEIEDLTRLDKNNRTVLHRAALDQNVDLVIQLCERAQVVEIENYVDTIDKFGNTPLLSACVVNSSQTNQGKLSCIETLIRYGADPNKRNDTTLWTPLHWCAFYGDTPAIKKLLENKAFPYLMDKDGCFPLDHCGLQDKHGNRRAVAKVLIEKLMKLIQIFDEGKESPASEGYKEFYRYLKSPLLRTSLLYWAIYFRLSVEDISKLITTEGVYPDFPIKTIYDRNCYHACAYEGEKEVLGLLLDKERHNNFYKNVLEKKRAMGYGNTKATIEREEADKIFLFTPNEIKNKTFSKEFMQYTKESVKWIVRFESAVAKMVIEEIEFPKYFEEQDYFGNTPLHVASFLGRAEIVDTLLKQGADMLIENKDGWRCQELKQYPKIEQLYKEHAKKLHEAEIATAMSRNIGIQLQIIPQLKAATVSPQKPNSALKNLFRNSKVGIAESITKQANKLQNALEEKFALYNEERFIPDVVLVFQTRSLRDNKISDAEMDRINFNISLIKTSFDCYLAANTTNTRFYLMIRMGEEDLENECASNSIKIKLLNAYGHQIYDPTRKVDFEPFRSRQRQEITLTSLNKLIDVQQLKDIGVLKDIYTMHSVSGIHRIKEIWFKKKWYWPEPLASWTDYIKEGKHLNFGAITTLRMYFGEKVAFYFAWVSFYTSFLLLLAIPGLAIAIGLWAYPDGDSFFLPLWSVYNSLCSTLVVERWKRKSAEIATRWGTIDMMQNASRKRILRTEFVGDETVHETTGTITKINPKNQTILYFILSVPILLVMLAAVVGSFLYTQHLQNNIAVETSVILRMLISAANGVIISVINYLYMNIARFFVDRENHKYADTYENSLIFKVFIFQFLNSYLGVIYVIFIDKEDLPNVQYMLMSLLITKQASSLATSCFIPWFKYKLMKSRYFGNMKSKAKADSKMEKQKNPEKESEDWQNQEWDIKRAVLNCRKGTPETDQWDLTRVELSSLRTRNDEFVDEFGSMFIQCGYITMFAPGFPMGPLISLVSNIIDIRARMFALLHIHHRPPTEKAGDIGVWQNIWEVTSVVGIFVNAILLFFRSTTTIGFLESWIMDKVSGEDNSTHDIRRLWVFLILVNVILILKLLVIALIKDKPEWVEKEEQRQNNEERQALQNQKTLTSLPGIFGHFGDHKGDTSSRNFGTNEKRHTTENDTQPDQGGLSSERSTKQEKDAQQSSKAVPKKLKINTQKEHGKDVYDQESKSPLNVSIPEVHYQDKAKSSMPLASIALDLNHGIKSLLYNAFTYVEKDLMIKRLGHLSKLMQEVVIKCDACKKDKALLECINCAERYCDKCLVQVHKKTVRTTHKIISLSKSSDGSQALKGVVADVVPQTRDYPTRDGDSVIWQKVESFSFPTLKVGDPYNNIEKAYKMLYRIYIEENGISEENTINDVELALKIKKKKAVLSNMKKPGEQKQIPDPTKKEIKFNLEQPQQDGGSNLKGSENKKELIVAKQQDLGEVDYEWLDEVKKFFDLPKFNIEEKMWMNRIAFMVFKRRGAKTTYNDFYRQLKILEEAPLEAKVLLLFDLVDEDSDGSITTNDLLKLLNVSFLQNTTSKNNQDEVFKSVLQETKALEKKLFVDEVLKNYKIKQILMAYMQS